MEKCVICLDEMTKGEVLMTTSCGHTFHKECFDLFEESNKKTILKCPSCRKIVRVPVFDEEQIENAILDYKEDWGELDCDGLIEDIRNSYGKTFEIDEDAIRTACIKDNGGGYKSNKKNKTNKKKKKNNKINKKKKTNKKKKNKTNKKKKKIVNKRKTLKMKGGTLKNLFMDFLCTLPIIRSFSFCDTFKDPRKYRYNGTTPSVWTNNSPDITSTNFANALNGKVKRPNIEFQTPREHLTNSPSLPHLIGKRTAPTTV
jgi:hypothetical protein